MTSSDAHCLVCGAEFEDERIQNPMLFAVQRLVDAGKTDDEIAAIAKGMASFTRDFNQLWDEAEQKQEQTFLPLPEATDA